MSDDCVFRNILYRIISSKAIIFALEHNLFDLCVIKRTFTEISEHVKIHPDKLISLLALCCSENLLKKEDECFINTEISKKYLTLSSDCNYYNFVKFLYIDNDEARNYSKLKNRFLGLDSGDVLFENDYFKDIDQVKSFINAMHCKSAAAAQHFFIDIDLDGMTLVDLGCGYGTFSEQVLNMYPNTSVILADNRVVLDIIEYRFQSFKNRVKTCPIDFFKNDLPVADVYVISDILHDWNKENCTKILTKIFNTLNHGGFILINEICFNDDFTGPFEAASYSISMNLMCEGRQYSFQEHKTILENIGFCNVSFTKYFGEWSRIVAFKA
jgi:ubiquinone/menaquinone biosynthesis C-methylase UbiE